MYLVRKYSEKNKQSIEGYIKWFRLRAPLGAYTMFEGQIWLELCINYFTSQSHCSLIELLGYIA